LSNDLIVGARLLERAATGLPRALRDPLIEAAEMLRKPGDPLTRAGAALSEEVGELLAQYPLRDQITRGERYGVWVDRPEARFSAWYEMFPRSTGGVDKNGKPVHGTFATAAKTLPRIAKMGFDVVYLPPIHPIGKVHRKGKKVKGDELVKKNIRNEEHRPRRRNKKRQTKRKQKTNKAKISSTDEGKAQ